MGTVPVPYSPVAGDDATAARVLTWADSAAYLLGSATSGGSRRALCVMRQTVAQSVPNATNTAITMDVEDVDYDNGHSTVTNTSRYTAATAGWHDVKWLLSWTPSATGWRLGWLRLNGAGGTDLPGTRVELPVAAGAISSTAFGASSHIFLNVGDYIELMAYQNAGGALNTSVTAPASSKLCIEWRSN